MAINTILAVMNIIIGLYIAYESAYFYWSFRWYSTRFWITIWYSVIGLIWAGIFTYILLSPEINRVPTWHSIIVWPAVNLTLTAIAASAIMRRKAYKRKK